MPAAEVKQLLRAIEDFTEAYGGDDKFASVLESLEGVTSDLQQAVASDEPESPGRASAREAAEEKREKPPALREAREADDNGEEPRSFGEARERARKRFPDRSSRSGEREPAGAKGGER